MKSRTSFCNFTAIKKNITRFAPVWGLYTVFLLLVLFSVARRGYSAILAREMADAMNSMALVNIFYGGICAFILFGDLYNSRICNALHALPLLREGWLMTHILSGVLFGFVPNCLVTILASVLMWEYAYIAWIWLAVVMLQFLFFFGTGVLSAVCAGNRLAMIAIYGIIQFASLLVYAVTELLYLPLLYGVQLDFEKFSHFFPLLQMVERKYVEFMYYPTIIEGQFLGFGEKAWGIIGICAILGIVSIWLACLVYRRRNLESAGDFISLKPIAPVFLIIYTIGVGSVFYLFSEVFSDASYVYLAIGLAVGYFTGLMLLRRTTKVFTKKSALGLVVLAAVFAGSMWLTWLDPLGITTKIPDREDVQWAAAYSTDQAYWYTQEEYPYRYCIADDVEIVSLQQFHTRLAADKKTNSDNENCQIRVHYKLKDGSDFIRCYEVDPNGDLGQEAKKRFSDIRYLFQVNDPEMLHDIFSVVNVECYDMDMGDPWKFEAKTGSIEMVSLTEKEQIKGLLEAIRKDAESGYIAQQHQFHENERYVFHISFEGFSDIAENKDLYKTHSSQDYYYCGISVYDSCIHTIAYLQKLHTSN